MEGEGFSASGTLTRLAALGTLFRGASERYPCVTTPFARSAAISSGV